MYLYLRHTVNVLQLAIWHEFELAFHSNQLNYTLINAYLAMYLIWRMDTTAKGAKKNTSPNVIHLQYFCLFR